MFFQGKTAQQMHSGHGSSNTPMYPKKGTLGGSGRVTDEKTARQVRITENGEKQQEIPNFNELPDFLRTQKGSRAM